MAAICTKMSTKLWATSKHKKPKRQKTPPKPSERAYFSFTKNAVKKKLKTTLAVMTVFILPSGVEYSTVSADPNHHPPSQRTSQP